MRRYSRLRKNISLWLLLSIAPTAFLEGLRLAVDTPFSWDKLAARWVFVIALLLVVRWTQPRCTCGTLTVWPWPGIVVAGLGVGAALVYAVSEVTWAAWVTLSALYLLLLDLDTTLTSGRGVLRRWVIHALFALAGGVIPVSIAQIESHFASEELFAALQALALALLWMLLLGARTLLVRLSAAKEPVPAGWGLRLDRRWLGLYFVLLSCMGIWASLRAYQRSFFPYQAPVYAGVSRQSPYICGEIPSGPESLEGEEVFRRLVAQVEANPRKGPPEYGMLALGTGERRWALAFREGILSEAAEGRFTAPVLQVKYWQHQAALRVYYLFRVNTAFPDLFSDADKALLDEWLADINRKALTIEPADWIYALAFSKQPAGPYENQENGAGLLALLEHSGHGADDLSEANWDYLQRNQRGWMARFRNTDDTFIYQPVWLTNAYFQSLNTGQASDGPTELEENKRLSFEWLLLQALPDGAPLRYNHPAYHSLAGVAYLGAQMLEDPRYVWLAGRSLTYVERQGGYLTAQPGVDQPISLEGYPPTQGSCLLYGDSGLPNQLGPLAPDKIVFRDGWAKDSAYLLLNLRFSGWHRYKATNTVALIYRDGPLVTDALDGASFTWLPVERSLFRDKRIPRENLNGLLIERSGMSAVLHTLTGIGGIWAQDPPHYAEVVAFETGDELDWAHTRLAEWRGWRHDRWVYFYHNNGPIIVVDVAEGPPRSQAALAWHLARAFGDERAVEGGRIWLRSGHNPAEMLLVPGESEGYLKVTDGDSVPRVVYYAPPNGQLRTVTLFLQGRWVDAQVSQANGYLSLLAVHEEGHIFLPLPEGW